SIAGLGVRGRVARSRELVAKGRRPATVARVMGVSRQAIYRSKRSRPAAAGPGRAGPEDAAIVGVARANPTDGTRMVAALASRELDSSVRSPPWTAKPLTAFAPESTTQSVRPLG